MRHIDIKSFSEVAGSLRQPFHDKYYAMYSSVYGGIVVDPALMMIPMDDHMVHRGDGVFEVFKCINWRIYNMKAHVARLLHSASVLKYALPCAIDDIRDTVVETISAGRHKDCTVHLFVSRGPGSFSVNPFDCPASQLYVVALQPRKPFMMEHPEGARARTSTIVAKAPFYAGVKSCNYLPNVLMKREAVELDVDFAVGFDNRGLLAEGATENMGIVTRDGRLLFPELGGILAGTTMLRVMELAGKLVESGELTGVAFADITRDDVQSAREFLAVGTTLNVAAIREFDGKKVANGKLGPVALKLNILLEEDMLSNRDLQTEVRPG